MSVGRFVDVERVVIAWLTSQLDEPVVETLPDPFTDTEAAAGLVRVQRAPGGETWPTGLPRVDVESFHTTRAGMWDLARRVHDAMRDLAGQAVADETVDAVEVSADPAPVQWSPSVERAIATYEPQFTVA